MAKKREPQASSPVWRECYDITDSGRLFVSSSGEVKFSLTTHHDSRTGRPYILLDGRPIFIDSLSLSMFGQSPRPRRCYDITHLDADLDNCAPDNLEWTSTPLRNDHHAPVYSSPTNLSYIMQRTVTPEMVQSHKYPIVNPVPAAEYSLFDSDLNQDVHSSGSASSESSQRPVSQTTAELSQRLSDLEDRLDKRPRDDEERVRQLARYIAEDIVGLNPVLRYISSLSQSEKNTNKNLCKLDVPYGYTIVRRKENGRWIWYRVNEDVLKMIEGIFSDVRSGKKPKDLLDMQTVRWRPYGKAEFEYLGDYIFDGNLLSEEDIGSDMEPVDEDSSELGRNLSGRPTEIKNIDKKSEIPDKTGSDMKPNIGFGGYCGRPVKSSEGISSDSADSSNNREDENFSRDLVRGIVEGREQIKTSCEDVPEIEHSETCDILERTAELMRKKDNFRGKGYDSGLSIEQIDEISSELKKMTATDMKSLHQLRCGWVATEAGGLSKPVIVTDMRNLREFYCPSVAYCAELLGVDKNQVGLALRGKLRQIGNYQLRFQNREDGIFVLQGLYKKYMDMLQNRRDELAGEDEEKKIQEEMDEINSEIERLMSEKEV